MPKAKAKSKSKTIKKKKAKTIIRHFIVEVLCREDATEDMIIDELNCILDDRDENGSYIEYAGATEETQYIE